MRYLRNRSSWENKRAQRNGDKNRLLLQRFVLDVRCFSGFFYQVQSTRLLGLALSGRANKSNGYGSYTELHMTRIAWLTRYFCKTAHLNRRLNLSEEYCRCSSQFFFLFSFLLSESPRQALDLVEFRYALQTGVWIKALSNAIRVDRPSHSISPMKSTLGVLNLPLTRNWKKNKNNLKFSGGELNFPYLFRPPHLSPLPFPLRKIKKFPKQWLFQSRKFR